MTKKNILIISHDKIGTEMAGPGIRYHQMANVLSKDFDVTIGFFNPANLPDENFKHSYKTADIDANNFKEDFAKFDAIITFWLNDDMLKFCKEKSIYLAFDIYAPVPTETLALFMLGGEEITHETDYNYKQSFASYKSFFQYGDLFLFSNKRQLDFWMGYVFGTGIVSVSSYIKRPFLKRFIYAPMGFDSTEKISHTKNVIRGKIKGIKDTDKILLWTGGIWNWFDAQTLIKSMKKLEKIRPDIKLVFFGIKHPNPDVPAMQEAHDAIKLAKTEGLLDKTVFMHEGWVPYGERINYLLEADVAVNTTKDTLENELAHRTRVLDHILTYLPTIATEGDYLSDEIIYKDGIGIVIPPDDVDQLADAIISSVQEDTNQQFRDNIKKIRNEYDWGQTLGPLRNALLTDMDKLEFVTPTAPIEIPKGSTLFKVTKKLLSRRIKSFIIKVTGYGR